MLLLQHFDLNLKTKIFRCLELENHNMIIFICLGDSEENSSIDIESSSSTGLFKLCIIATLIIKKKAKNRPRFQTQVTRFHLSGRLQPMVYYCIQKLHTNFFLFFIFSHF